MTKAPVTLEVGRGPDTTTIKRRRGVQTSSAASTVPGREEGRVRLHRTIRHSDVAPPPHSWRLAIRSRRPGI